MTEEFFTRRLAREQRARKEAELLLERKSAELYEANQQLLNMNLRLEMQAKELLCARDVALESSRLKSQFLANMSHEIRTPMNGVIGMTDLVLGTELTAEQREYLALARTSARALLLLINDILDLSKIEAGYLELEAIPFSISALISATIEPFALHARQKGLQFRYEADPGIPDRFVGDPTRLRQILINLIGNAIKFTSEGEVSLHIRTEPQIDGKIVLHFAVRDTGIGIAPDQQKAVFNAFTQVDGSIARRFGGTGLGLSIVSRLVQKMDGCISVESEPGTGSTFKVSVKVATDTSPAELLTRRLADASTTTGATCAKNRVSLRILVAEDNFVNQRVAACLLRRHGHSVVIAGNGREAVDVFGSQCLDAILMDVQMPEMDGYEAVAAIRAKERELGSRRVPIVALTAHAMKGDMERCLAAGMDDYVSKPIDFPGLMDKLFALIGRK